MARKGNKSAQAVSKNQTNAARPRQTTKVETVITPGVFEIPGGKLTLTDKGIMTYVGDPYLPIRSKLKYRQG